MHEAPKPRKAPKQSRSSHTVATILEAAAHILDVDGFSGYTTNAIAARAGVSIGSLYQYFPNKDAVSAALVKDDALRFHSRLQQAARDALNVSSSDAMDLLIDVSVKHQFDRPMLARLIDIEEDRLGMAGELSNLRNQTGQLLGQVLTFHFDSLPFPVADVTQDIFAIVRSMTDAAGARGEHDALRARIRKAVLGYLST